MIRVFMSAAHAGYGSESVPLGGGAAVCERLCRAWGRHPEVELTLIGPGPSPPQGIRYLRVDPLQGRPPSSLSALAYARFCRRFEEQVTAALLREARGGVVVCHDISEGPSFAMLRRHGVPCVPILHVDVADFFCRQYLGGRVGSAQAEAWMSRWRASPWVPDLLRLVFDKQQEAARSCPHLVVPSAGMAGVLEACYPRLDPGRIRVIPWGAPEERLPAEQVEEEKRRMASRWGLEPSTPVLVMLSRISPEKGHDDLLEALAAAEARGEVPEGLVLLLCGEAAFMQGAAYLARLRRLAGRLRRVRVLFPGHLGGAAKRAVLELGWVFISASRQESYGLTTMEAMAAGSPVVARETSGSLETVTPESGVLVPGSGAALWEAVRGLLDDPEARLRLGAGARARAAGLGFSEASENLLACLRGLVPGGAVRA